MNAHERLRDPALASKVLDAINAVDGGPLRIMEVCGTHTQVIFRSGLKDLLSEKVAFLSGPGCPVCVTPTAMIDVAVEFVRRRIGLLATFGDLVRVPGSVSSLEWEMASGGAVTVVYSVLDALDMARRQPRRPVVFFSVGFETTSPGIACAIDTAFREGVKNFFVIPANKLIPPAMHALLDSGETEVDGFLCPGHVSVIIGSGPYTFIPEQYALPCAVAGFESLDILQAVLMIFRQVVDGRPKVEIQYRRVVQREGNRRAVDQLQKVFEPRDSEWRGLGMIPRSGLGLREPYRSFDALEHFDLFLKPSIEDERCRCGDILRGVATPHQCPLFGGDCSPTHPVGSCMVSSEGTCAAYYRYSRKG